MDVDSTFFQGNEDAKDIFLLLGELAHIWDDLVDRDKPVDEGTVNRAFEIALVGLPANPLYRHIQPHILALWRAVIRNYAAANALEREGEAHGLEIAHTLRYSAGHIMAVVMDAALGPEQAAQAMPAIWKLIVAERIEPYMQEHLKC